MLEKLKKISDSIEGTIAVVFVSYDGVVVNSVISNPSFDFELLCAKYADVFKHLKQDGAVLKESIVYYDKFIVAAKPSEDGFIVVVLSPDSNVGKAKIELNRIGNVL